MYTGYTSFNPRLVQIIAKVHALFRLVLRCLHSNINACFPCLQPQYILTTNSSGAAVPLSFPSSPCCSALGIKHTPLVWSNAHNFVSTVFSWCHTGAILAGKFASESKSFLVATFVVPWRGYLVQLRTAVTLIKFECLCLAPRALHLDKLGDTTSFSWHEVIAQVKNRGRWSECWWRFWHCHKYRQKQFSILQCQVDLLITELPKDIALHTYLSDSFRNARYCWWQATMLLVTMTRVQL